MMMMIIIINNNGIGDGFYSCNAPRKSTGIRLNQKAKRLARAVNDDNPEYIAISDCGARSQTAHREWAQVQVL